MKLTVLQENLKRGLAMVGRAVAAKSTLPVLSNVLLQTDDGRLQLAATNLDIGIKTAVGAKIEDEGAVTLPFKLLSDIVSGLPNAVIELTLDEKTQTVAWACGSFKGTIRGIESDEFPVLPAITGSAVELPADVLRAVGSRVAVAALTDDTKPVLRGVYMTLGEYARFVAADSYRLADLRIPLETPTEPQEAIIPAGALSALGAIIEGDSVVVLLNENMASFRSGATELRSRLIAGKYPDVDRLIPAQWATRMIAKTVDLAKAIKLAGYYATTSSNIVRLAFESKQLTISANAAEIGDNSGMVELEALEGGDLTIALNYNYLAQAVGSCAADMVAIEMQSPTDPAVLRPVGDETYLHVCMPMVIR